VPQDGFLFSDTIANNIAFGSKTFDEANVHEAARLAVVDKEIERFPNGYKTMVGERGVTLSGGQKQRVSIARALLKESPILLLDDCLSAVDARTEREILGHLETYLQGKTAIIITHRIFSLLHFDKIIVLQKAPLPNRAHTNRYWRVADYMLKCGLGNCRKTVTRMAQQIWLNEK
jgi:ATP-binding cassette subfamily B protein